MYVSMGYNKWKQIRQLFLHGGVIYIAISVFFSFQENQYREVSSSHDQRVGLWEWNKQVSEHRFLENTKLGDSQRGLYLVDYICLSTSSKEEIAGFTVSASLRVVEVCLDNFNLPEDIDLVCLAIKLLFSSIQQWQNDAMDSQTDDQKKKADGREYLKEEYVRKLSEKVASKLKRALSSNVPEYYLGDALSRELKVRILINVVVTKNGVAD